jgi:hypothetical protein
VETQSVVVVQSVLQLMDQVVPDMIHQANSNHRVSVSNRLPQDLSNLLMKTYFKNPKIRASTFGFEHVLELGWKGGDQT